MTGRVFLKDIVVSYVVAGMTAYDVKADYPRFRLSSIGYSMSMARKRMGLSSVLHRSGDPLHVPADLGAKLKSLSVRHGRKSAHELAVELLAIVVNEDMVAAVLDDERIAS